ncbi:MAG: hypothetical protein AAGF23_17570, partial [Acidobacteriota bacterium]
MKELRPPPRLELPVALLRFWPTAAESCALLAALDSDDLPEGMRRLGPSLVAVLPTAGRGAVVQLAVNLAKHLLAKARPSAKAAPSAELPGLLIYPGTVAAQGEFLEVLPDGLFEDLEERAPKLPAATIAMTGYAAAWIAGRFVTTGLEAYQGPSGRRVALQSLDRPRLPPLPFHNHQVFGRRVS